MCWSLLRRRINLNTRVHNPYMPGDSGIRFAATKVRNLTIQGKSVNPWLIGIDLRSNSAQLYPVEMRIGLTILVFELRQCEVHSTEANILQFVSEDIRKHQEKALHGYLTIVRHVINPLPIKKHLGWFSRMVSRSSTWTPPPVRWNWVRIGEVKLPGDKSIAISGMCCDANEIGAPQPAEKEPVV
jgi:hypothetical protein